MWHEARKQEKKIREAVVDFQKRAERRRQHYAKQRRDPMQLLRLYGTRSPLHLNPTASKMSSTMISWQGDETNMISRYDVRINLDYIPEHAKLPRPKKSMSEEWEEQRCNYERYRFLVLNQFRGVSEQDALAAIEVNEMYLVPGRPLNSGAREKAKSQARAAIGYRYGGMEDGESEQERRDEQLLADYLREDDEEEDEEKAFSSESEYEVDIDVDQYSSADVDKLNVTALEYGIAASAFSRNLRSEKQHMEETKLARLNDLEKSALPGKRARRERRQLRERTHPRLPTPPSYARRDSPTYEPYEQECRSRSSSRSSSPVEGQVEFITEFGGGGVADQPTDHTHHSTAASSRVTERWRDDRTRDTREGREEEGRSSRSLRYRSPQRRRSRSHSPRRRSSHHSSHRDSRSRSRSRSRDRSHHKSSYRSSSRDRRKRSRSRSRDRSHTHPSTSSNDITSATPSPKKKLPLKSKDKPAMMKGKMTPQERLKKKMQAQLTKQFKQDKKLQKEKEHKKETERIEREEELRDHMRKIRGRERSQWERDDRWSRSPSPHGYAFYDH